MEPSASASNALRLVIALGDRGRVRVTDVAAELNVAPSTAHRLLAVLVRWGFAIQEESRWYSQGPAYSRLRLSGLAPETLRVMIRPHLVRLAGLVGETTHLVVLEGTQVSFVTSAEGPGALRVASRQGARLPAHLTSGGKALLAEMSDQEIDLLFAGSILGTTGTRIHSRAALLAEMATVRERGFAINSDESEPGITAVGIALRHRGGQPLAGLSISAPTVRFSTELVTNWVEQLRHTAQNIESTL